MEALWQEEERFRMSTGEADCFVDSKNVAFKNVVMELWPSGEMVQECFPKGQLLAVKWRKEIAC